ncbi:cilium assembly protein DZIP1L-like isoform X2 [Bolinopsis microptera]|uniref:cilium assembly protein DZIP1L-like isoform X2 n=1 Tax=Bolinopsis microptera TaxID=2820187 RepID=UPI0030794C72
MKMVDKENQPKGVQFQFRKRYRKVDWKLLANVDVDKITRELDYQALQANIMNVAFCDTNSQDFVEVDDDFIKLYKLGQYTIEYLLHCQEYLSHGTVELESKLREAMRFRNEVKDKLEVKQKELTDCKKESRKRKKMIAVYQSMLNTTGVNGFHKCSHCEKAFVSAPFLASHLERRHGIVPQPVQNTEDKLRIANEELEKELQTLKEKYMSLEEQLKGAQERGAKAETLRDSTLQQQIQQEVAHKTWSKETEERCAQEIEKVKEIYLKEASDALEEKRIAELALVEAKKGIVSNLGALRDEKHEHDELRQEQLSELEGQFEFKISQLQQEMELQARKLRNTEEEHRQAIDELQQREERLIKQLDGKTVSEQRLQEILNAMEVENAKLVQMNKEKPDIRSTFSPAVLAQLNNIPTVENSPDLDVVQKLLASQPVTMLQESSSPAKEVPLEKRHIPFVDKPYIKTYYEHPTDAIDAARKELQNEIAIRLLNATGSPDIDSLSNEDYHHYKEQIDRNRIAKNTSHVIQQLDSQLADICQRVNSGSHHGSPRGSVSASPIPTTLPPKSPSFRRSRESLSRPNSSKRTKTSGPASLQGESTPNHVITTPRDAMAKSREDFQSPSSPDLSAENLVASTPKISAKSSENIVGTQPEHAYDLDFDDDDDDSDSVDQDVSEIELPDESTIPRASQHVLQGISRDEHVESDESEEIPEEEAYSDDNAFDDDELFEEAEKPTPGYSLRDPNYNPLDDDSEDEMEESRSPSPVVKRRPTNKSYREEDDSIFSFDGWSKMKNRNSMSADDAQQNIPMGHVAKMRQAVDELNRAKRVKTGVKTGVEIVPKGNECKTKQPKSCPIDGEEDDDFTISSLSDRDMSPVEMKVDIKRSSRNGIDDVL